MNRTLTFAATFAAAALLAAPAAHAQDTTTQTQAPAQQERQIDYTALTDAQFLQMAAYSGLMEATLSDEAEERADNNEANANLEKYAEMMIKDHKEVNEALVKLAEAKSIDLKQTLPERMKQQYDRLVAIEDDNDFLRQYLTYQVRAHDRAVKLFAAMAEHADDADIRAFGEKYLPTLKTHLETTRKLAGVDATEVETTTPPRP